MFRDRIDQDLILATIKSREQCCGVMEINVLCTPKKEILFRLVTCKTRSGFVRLI